MARSIDNMWKRDALSLDEVAKLYEMPSRRRFKMDIDRALQMLLIRMQAEVSGEDNEPAPSDATNPSCTPENPCWNCWECNDDIPRPAIQKTDASDYRPATDGEILTVLQPNIGLQTTSVARAVLTERGVARPLRDERSQQSGSERLFVSFVAQALRRLGGLPGTACSTHERAEPRVLYRGRKWTVTRAGIAFCAKGKT
jgi:hypothetical protein